MYNQFVGLIKPFNNKTINKHKIKMKFNDRKNSIDFFIDGNLYTTFSIETRYHGCNCSECHDGQTDHQGEYAHELSSFIIKKGQRRSGPYFFWYARQEEDDFVSTFDEFISKYHKDMEWKKTMGDNDEQDEEFDS